MSLMGGMMVGVGGDEYLKYNLYICKNYLFLTIDKNPPVPIKIHPIQINAMNDLNHNFKL